MMNDQQIITLGGSLIMMLLAGNAYFIKRLIDKIESTATTANSANAGVSAVSALLREIKADIKNLSKVEMQVAVLTALYSKPRKPAKRKDDDADDGCEAS